MLNKTVLMGRLTHNPELKHTPSGMTFVNFSLAVERDFKDKQSGEKVTDFVECVAWSHNAEFICQYFGKGRTMIVSGRLQTDSYTDKDGNKRKSIKIVVENAYFGDSKPSVNKYLDQNQSQPRQSAIVAAQNADFALLDEDDSELPFDVT
jgi:single-strand DNA-binding protein